MNIDQEKEYRIVRSVLESAYQSKRRIRVFYGDTETGRDWMEENDIMGYVGRSTGTERVFLLVHNSRSMGGSAILTKNVVRITIDRRDVYRHPLYHQPILSIEGRSLNAVNYPHTVWSGGKQHAAFKTHEQARRFVQFLSGKRNAK